MKWFEWKKSVFDIAKREKKPILLFISASWCHWCHTMDRLVYSDDKITEFIASNFIPIRVDATLRPDLNDRYNSGGYPTTLILAHNGEPVWGSLYVSREHMLGFLKEGLDAFNEYKPCRPAAQKFSRSAVVDLEEEVFDLVRAFYDPQNKGFGLEPKFPHVDLLEFLVWRVLNGNDGESERMLKDTLHAMRSGEIFDSIGGGFFRYASQRDWSLPHFEKLLEDNARMLSILINAYNIFEDSHFLDAANKVVFFLFTILYDKKKGVFVAGQVADEDYCKLPFEGRISKRPSLDNALCTDSNAIAALAFLIASDLEEEYESHAERILNFLLKNAVKRGGVVHATGGRVCLLRDAVFLLAGLVAMYSRSRKKAWLDGALKVASLLSRFEDKTDGGFFDVLPSNNLGRLAVKKKPLAENALAASVLMSLSRLSGNRSFSKKAYSALEAITPIAERHAVRAVNYVIAVREVMG
ncbi:thioredoxin domain-containing protein [Candidatus Woesearchaeota archaeon]|nr:MAG: thioredoxin domain-containing protein [Candidatus Woesearchaeota archaeon]